LRYLNSEKLTGLFSYPKRKLKKLIREGEYQEAITLGNTMDEEYRYDPDYLFIMAGMFYILDDAKKTLDYVDRVLEINEFDVEALGLKLRIHQHFKENDKVIDCCKRILKIDSDAYEVRDILNNLEQQ
jgi:tetratricopeptide (TPR) repeat protein|tara:strand:- start:61 stop:444 length:384 start_codon:yes stop_codon:yes gene_type:complete